MSSIPTCVCAVCDVPFEVPSGRGQWRKYCSPSCNNKAYRARRKQERATFPLCELDECSTPCRSRNSRWCEAHYIRWYRHGDPRARASTAREPNGICFHCGGPSPKRIFCSQLCSTRDRIGASYEERLCPVCDAAVPITDRADRVYCTQRCADAGIRARRYGLTIADFRELVARHGEVCAICGQKSDKMHIDHCHTTGKVRGMLCSMCNLGIGYFSDDTARLLRAVAYLRERGAKS